jgi:hypothetical protein
MRQVVLTVVALVLSVSVVGAAPVRDKNQDRNERKARLLKVGEKVRGKIQKLERNTGLLTVRLANGELVKVSLKKGLKVRKNKKLVREDFRRPVILVEEIEVTVILERNGEVIVEIVEEIIRR